MKPLAIRLSVTTVYLLPCRAGYLQIDTAYPQDYGLFRRKLAEKGIDIRDIKIPL